MPSARFSTKPLYCIGLDVETEATTGECRLIGVSYGDTQDRLEYPTLDHFFAFCEGITNNSFEAVNLVTWGTLDLQVILRLFSPTEHERKQISRGISANVKQGKIIGDPPLIRMFGDLAFYVATYLPGRALKLAILEDERERSIWIYNLAQFYNARIADTAKALKLPWRDFAKDTHLIDWKRYKWDAFYRKSVIASNTQDAITVQKLAENLQRRYADVFESYPNLLVSAGSLTDAAVGKMLHEDEDDDEYNSTSWAWLTRHCYTARNQKNLVVLLDEFLAEAFSAGYVDQFAVGYFPKAYTADISSAYPYQIRNLHDLRNAHFEYGENQIEKDYLAHFSNGWSIETAIIRGVVSIPTHLRYHPITTRTPQHENYRPQGTFEATYTLEERSYCRERGATFEDEEYIFVLLPTDDVREASISRVSVELGQMRDRLRKEISLVPNKDSDEYRVLDGQQYLVKVVDNSIYGKMVMTTEIVENVDDGSGAIGPHITGYNTGDRFNLLYGTLITARTRVRLSEAMNAIEEAGGKPIMAMTDSVYYVETEKYSYFPGDYKAFPSDMVRVDKTAGYFEPPHEIQDLYLLKTGQYEYQTFNKDKQKWVWEHKIRGLRLDRATIQGKSYFRTLLKEHCRALPRATHPKSIQIKLPTHRLISIGSYDLEHLGMIEDGEMFLAPFTMSTKEADRYILDWRKCLDGNVWLPAKQVKEGARQFAFLDMLYEEQSHALTEEERYSKKVQNLRSRNNKRQLVYALMKETEQQPPEDWLQKSVKEILEHYARE